MSERVERLSTGRPWATRKGSANGPDPAARRLLDGIQLLVRRFAIAERADVQLNHFYRSVLDALEFDGPAVICCYTTCQAEHGVADNMATDQARLAVDTRAFPLLVYDPRKGNSIRGRLSLQGNPAVTDDWWAG